MSDTQIAQHVGVSDKTIAKYREELQASLEVPKMSDRQIAEHVGVSAPTVGKVRKELESTMQIAESPTRTGRDELTATA